MPRYFFNVMNDIKTQDVVGIDLPNLEAAKVEAQRDIDDIMASHFATLGHNWPKWSIEICDRQGTVLLIVPFSIN